MADKPDSLDKVGQFLKLDRGNVEAIRSGIEAAQSIASAVSSVMGAYSSAKAALEYFGLIEAPSTIDQKLDELQAGVDRIIQAMGNNAEAEKLVRRKGWQTAVLRANSAVGQLSRARSPAHLDEAQEAITGVVDALHEMLLLTPDGDPSIASDFGMATVPQAGVVPFLRSTYRYRPFPEKETNKLVIDRLPDHWIDYANGSYLKTRAGAPVDYISKSADLAKRIWDPGYYLDVLVYGVDVLLRCLALLEPAFRQTGERREALSTLAKELEDFADRWERSIIVTNLDVAVGPPPNRSLSHPYSGFWNDQYGGTIALVVADPVTGTTVIDHAFSGGVKTSRYGWNEWSYDDDALPALAVRALAEMTDEVIRFCGVRDLRSAAMNIAEAAHSPYGTLFCSVDRPSRVMTINPRWSALPVGRDFRLRVRPAPKDELFALEDTGALAGRPQQLYPVKRYSNIGPVERVVTMVRRMDSSHIQLGYELEVSIAAARAENGGATKRFTLCSYSAPSHDEAFGEKLPDFPVGEWSATLSTDNATVFDLVQTAPFGVDDDRDVAPAGGGRMRLEVNERSGPASIAVSVRTVFDDDSPDFPFVGYALVSIELNDAERLRDAFHVTVTAHEASFSSVTGRPDDRFTSSATVTIAPTFLVAPEGLFEDHLEALVALVKSYDVLYAEDRTPSRPDPVELAVGLGRHKVGVEFLRQGVESIGAEDPERVAGVLARFAPPTLDEEP